MKEILYFIKLCMNIYQKQQIKKWNTLFENIQVFPVFGIFQETAIRPKNVLENK